MVLMQFEHGYLLASPGDALDLAHRLTEVADEVEAGHGDRL